MSEFEEYQSFLLDSGFPLTALGLKELALSRQDALHAVRLLRSAERPILGGDAYIRDEGKTESTFANWYADPKPAEDREDFLTRSWEAAEAFITSYPKPGKGEPMFTIVAGEAKKSNFVCYLSYFENSTRC